MLVEPDVLIRMTVAEYLRECGYRVVEAITGEEALRILGVGVRVVPVLSAVQLRGAVDGFALAERVREHFAGVKVILTTGIAMTAKKAGQLSDQGPRRRPNPPKSSPTICATRVIASSRRALSSRPPRSCLPGRRSMRSSATSICPVRPAACRSRFGSAPTIPESRSSLPPAWGRSCRPSRVSNGSRSCRSRTTLRKWRR